MSSAAASRPVTQPGGRAGMLALRGIGLGYLALLVAGPVGLLIYRTFSGGLAPVIEALTRPAAVHAFLLTLLIVAIVIPLNTAFGIAAAIVIVRQQPRGVAAINALLALPLGVSPVIAGLSIVLLYGARTGWFGPWLMEHGVRVIFAVPGMVIATLFVTLPLVAREVIPVLQEVGTDQEQAARILGASGWQTFLRITLPSIRAGVAYGVVLTAARALGEYGAVAIVSGKLSGRTETMTLLVEERWLAFDLTAAYAASLVLALMALLTLVLMRGVHPREER